MPPMPPLTLHNTPAGFFQCPHWPFSIPPLDFWHRNWKCPTPRLKFYPQAQLIRLDTPQTQLDTPQIRLDTPQIRLDTPQIRLNTTLNGKSNWIRTKFDWIRPPKALNRGHWGFTGVQAVSWKTYATISTNSTKSQPNQNRKIATSPVCRRIHDILCSSVVYHVFKSEELFRFSWLNWTFNMLHLEDGYWKSYVFDFSSFIIRLVIVLFFLNTVVALTFFLRTCLSLVPIL